MFLCNKELNVLLIDLPWENSIDVLWLGVTFGTTLCDIYNMFRNVNSLNIKIINYMIIISDVL